MIGDPVLQRVWLAKNDEQDAFKDAFERHKKAGLFKGLDELHRTWGELCETGSHATINSLSERFVNESADDAIRWGLRYCGLEHDVWEKSLFALLLTCFTMEQTFYSDYESRLRLDHVLFGLRADFESFKERVRTELIGRYRIPPPV